MYNIYWSPSFFSHVIVWMLCLHMYAIRPITAHWTSIYISSQFVCLCYMPDKALEGRNVALKWPIWSDKSFIRVLESECFCVYMCVSVCVWQWPLASNCLFPVQTNKQVKGRRWNFFDGYTVSETIRQTNWVQWHKSSTRLWRDNMGFWLLWKNTRVYYSFS